MRAALAAVAVLGLAAAACSKPSEPTNPPIAAEQNQEKVTPASGDNSFTEAQAMGHLENAGYTDVTGMTQDEAGVWNGTATKDGKSMSVAVDYQGGVTAK